jgi:hypothetical protein
MKVGILSLFARNDRWMKLPAFCILFLLPLTFVLAQPEWLDPVNRQKSFPDKEYLVGFTSLFVADGKDPNQLTKEARQLARLDLAESISLSILSQTKLSISNQPEGSFTNFDKKSITTTQLEAYGLKTEDYYDQQSTVVYSFCYVPKKTLIKGYYKLLSRAVNQAKTGLNYEELTDPELIYDQLMKGLYLLQVAKGYTEMLRNLDVENELVLQSREQIALGVTYQEELKALKNDAQSNLGLALRFLVDQLTLESSIVGMELNVIPITYKNTGLATEFSSYFHDRLKQHLAEKVVLTSKKSLVRVSGNYWINDEYIHVAINIHQYDGDEPYKLMAGESIAVKRSDIEDLAIYYLPEQKDEDLLNVYLKEISEGGLVVRISTQKGREGLYFKEGEPLKLYITSSLPAYVRLVNAQDDGTQISLLENYYIFPEQTNQQIEVPLEYITICPCGREVIKLYAQKDPFPAVDITEEDGLEVISESLEKMTDKSRSLINSSQLDYYYGESFIQVTTLADK